MGWFGEVILLLLAIRHALSGAEVETIDLPQNFMDEEIHQNFDNIELQPMTLLHRYENLKLDNLGRILTNVLVQPWPRGASPIVYVENIPVENHEEIPANNDTPESEEISNTPLKRTRYYRKYPWKRQNSRYDAENRYLCQPSKEDVFRLLVALHEARQGNRGQMVNFCNRKRPASVVFTNIRFLG